MNGMTWWKDEAYDNIVGTFNLQMLVNQMAAKYKTNIVASKVDPNVQTINDKYSLEVWYNFDSMCHIINIYRTEVVDNLVECL